MKAKIIPIIILLFPVAILFTSCEDSTYRIYTANVPVYLSYDELRDAVTPGHTEELKNPGKIYFKDNYIFIIEELKGIHIYDNTNPASPVKKDFVTIPGVVDISISGNYLYADSYVDIVVIDVSDISNVHEAGRVKDVLPFTLPATGNNYPITGVDSKKGVITGWNVGSVKEKVYVNPYPIYYDFFFLKGSLFLDAVNSMGASSGVSGSGVGLGGSMARFAIRSDYLYAVDQNSLRIFDISTKTSPTKISDFYVGWNIETMFLTESNMFLGTSTGMAIYDITSPSAPQYKSFYNHMRSCDPVVVDDTLAYVTLRSGTNCGGSFNQLDVVNIKNLASPVMVASYPMTSPHGLGKDGNLLFVCDGNAGLKVFDATDPRAISAHLLFTYSQINAFDVIPLNSVLIMIGDDGLYQYDYSNPSDIKLLSKISVTTK
ncbi:MAG: hypothetical protein U0T33_08765 [Bacteroidales bacterium]